MRNLQNEATGTQFTAEEYNALKNDIIRVALSAGITIDGPNGPDSSDGHLSQGIATYAQNSSYYTDVGVADNYVLTKGVTNFKEPEVYTEGQIVWTNPLNNNTGPTTIKVGALPLKNVVTPDGVALTPNAITAGAYTGFVYRQANDRFELLFAPVTAAQNITNTTIGASNNDVISITSTSLGNSREWFVGIKETSGSLQKNFTVTARIHATGIDYTVYGITGDTIPTQITISKVSTTISLKLTNNHSSNVDIDAKLVV